MKLKFFPSLFLALITASCVAQAGLPYELASLSENGVMVSIFLDQNAGGGYVLSATFTPPEGYHLYSKDIPLTGVDGLGRPTLLELTKKDQIVSMGGLIESKPAEIPNFEPRDLLVYPPGPVTLHLPIQLPSGDEWVEDMVKITYMACSEGGCKAPVTGRLVPVHIPGENVFSKP